MGDLKLEKVINLMMRNFVKEILSQVRIAAGIARETFIAITPKYIWFRFEREKIKNKLNSKLLNESIYKENTLL